jgi:hypothetical protein
MPPPSPGEDPAAAAGATFPPPAWQDVDLRRGCGGDASVNANAVDKDNSDGDGGNGGDGDGGRDLALALAQPHPLDLSFALSGTRTATLHRDTTAGDECVGDKLNCTTKAAPLLHTALINHRAAGGGLGAGGDGNGNGGLSSFYGLILWEDGERKRRRAGGAHPPLGSSSFTDHPSLSPDGLGAAVIVLVVDSVDNLDVRLVMEVHRSSLARSLRQTLKSSCKEAGIVVPIYTWERWQSCCKLHKLLHLDTRTREAGVVDVVVDVAVADCIR